MHRFDEVCASSGWIQRLQAKLRGRAETIRRLEAVLDEYEQFADRQSEMIRELGNPEVTELHYTPGKLDIEMRSKLVSMLAGTMAEMLDGEGAANLVEWTINHPEKGPLTLTLQRQYGKSPMQLYAGVVRELRDAKDAAVKLTECDLQSIDWDERTITLRYPDGIDGLEVRAGLKIKADMTPMQPATETEPPVADQTSIL